ncbi:hypothetical protein MMPV_005215 [Pyropia vietnamensis]
MALPPWRGGARGSDRRKPRRLPLATPDGCSGGGGRRVTTAAAARRPPSRGWGGGGAARWVVPRAAAAGPADGSTAGSTATVVAGASGDGEGGVESLLAKIPFKRVAIWAAFFGSLVALRSFLSVILMAFILGYIGQTVVRWGGRVSGGRLPRRSIVAAYYALIVSLIGAFSIMTVPTVIRESQYFIRTMQSENPYVFVADGIRRMLGDELAGKLESAVLIVLNPPQLDETASPAGRLTAGGGGSGLGAGGGTGGTAGAAAAVAGTLEPPSSTFYSTSPKEREARRLLRTVPVPVDPPVVDASAWTEARSRRLGILLQLSIRGYVTKGASLLTRLVGQSTKTAFKGIVAILFSAIFLWDLPRIAAGVRSLRRSRARSVYLELAPRLGDFADVLGKSFEAQTMIALVNTSLTSLGLVLLGIPGVGFLSLVTLLCSFIPVAGVFVSTFPMLVLALSDCGLAKSGAVLLMVAGVHVVEAYVLNPQIYSAHLHLHPILVLVVLYVAEHMYGVPGLLLAVPVTVFLLRQLAVPGSTPAKRMPSGEAAAEAGEVQDVDAKEVL